jgi:hypothetical protein
MKINNTGQKLTEHFKHKELFTKSADFVGKTHDLSDQVIKGLEFIRSYYGVPLVVTSSFRTVFGNESAGGKSQSYHLQGKAIDFQNLADKTGFAEKFKKDFQAVGSELKGNLDFLGVRGVFFYDTFIHIDSRGEAATGDYTVKNKLTPFFFIIGLFLFISSL